MSGLTAWKADEKTIDLWQGTSFGKMGFRDWEPCGDVPSETVQNSDLFRDQVLTFPIKCIELH